MGAGNDNLWNNLADKIINDEQIVKDVGEYSSNGATFHKEHVGKDFEKVRTERECENVPVSLFKDQDVEDVAEMPKEQEHEEVASLVLEEQDDADISAMPVEQEREDVLKYFPSMITHSIYKAIAATPQAEEDAACIPPSPACTSSKMEEESSACASKTYFPSMITHSVSTSLAAQTTDYVPKYFPSMISHSLTYAVEKPKEDELADPCNLAMPKENDLAAKPRYFPSMVTYSTPCVGKPEGFPVVQSNVSGPDEEQVETEPAAQSNPLAPCIESNQMTAEESLTAAAPKYFPSMITYSLSTPQSRAHEQDPPVSARTKKFREEVASAARSCELANDNKPCDEA